VAGGFNTVRELDDLVPVRTVLVSVSDKTALPELVDSLLTVNPEIMVYSTGGTYSRIREILGDSWQKNLSQVSDYTGQPEMQGGLVKTLDYRIYLGLLSEPYNEAHRADLDRLGASLFDMTVVNLYPFTQAVAAEDVTLEEARAHIDIGGPTMLRASAKNFIRVAAVCRPEDYAEVGAHLKTHGGATTLALRFELARRAFRHTAGYDTAIAAHLDRLEAESALAQYNTGGSRTP